MSQLPALRRPFRTTRPDDQFTAAGRRPGSAGRCLRLRTEHRPQAAGRRPARGAATRPGARRLHLTQTSFSTTLASAWRSRSVRDVVAPTPVVGIAFCSRVTPGRSRVTCSPHDPAAQVYSPQASCLWRGLATIMSDNRMYGKFTVPRPTAGRGPAVGADSCRAYESVRGN